MKQGVSKTIKPYNNPMIRYLLYIDPGTGSLLYQAILSVVLTLSVFGSKIKMLFVHILRNIKARKGHQEE